MDTGYLPREVSLEALSSSRPSTPFTPPLYSRLAFWLPSFPPFFSPPPDPPTPARAVRSADRRPRRNEGNVFRILERTSASIVDRGPLSGQIGRPTNEELRIDPWQVLPSRYRFLISTRTSSVFILCIARLATCQDICSKVIPTAGGEGKVLPLDSVKRVM